MVVPGRFLGAGVAGGYGFVMGEPVGFLITWTCYGAWLHGTSRGSVDQEHNAYGLPLAPVSVRRESAARKRLKHPAVRLAVGARRVVATTIDEHSRLRGWEVLAVNVRSNHVHVVVRFAGIAPETMMGQWKAWSSRRLREAGVIAPGRSVWTNHGSTRYIWRERDLEGAVGYVVEGQSPERFGDRESEHRAPAQ